MSFYCSARRAGVAALLFALLATGAVLGQGPAVGATTVRPDGTPTLIRLPASGTGAQRAADARQVLRQYLRLGANDDMRPLRTETDALGYVHERFQQYYRGVRVEHGRYSVHRRGGVVETLSGELKRLGTLNVQPTLTAAVARQRALAAVGARHYMWQDAGEEQALRRQTGNARATYFPTGELVLVNDFRQRAAPLVLAWKFDIYATEPLSRAWVYVDARTGQVVLTDNLIKHAAQPGALETRYSGGKTALTDSTAAGYRLGDASRGGGIQTFNLQKHTRYTQAVDFLDADNRWTAAEYDNANFDNAALDAHYGAQATYDYWRQVHGRNSFDNAGAPIISYVHYGSGYENAFWNGMVMSYGDGVRRFSPLTSLDVCAHEIGHAVCQHTAALIYQNEPGSLNEGFSDIWGACVEYFREPTKQTWLIGEDITRTAVALRSLSNPKQFSQPNTYEGAYWVDTTAAPTASNDYGGVHTNSGVLNYWFYLLSVGGTGTNDKGTAYGVSGIGIGKAAAIAYRAEWLYLTSTAGFADARNATLQAACDLYGAGAAEVAAVAQAWYAVGVGEAPPTLAGLSPASGPIGASVTLTGTHFLTTTGVKFNGVAAPGYVVNSATSLTVLVPAGATSGRVTLTTPSGTATSAGNFGVTSTGAVPTIATLTPGGGQVIGGTVTIGGTNFGGATGVTFNGAAAIITAQTATSLTVTVPAGATTGPLRVTAPGGIATAAYSVLPAIAALLPPAGVVGTPVTLTGSSFAGATGVSFNGTAASFRVVSSTTIVATVPAGATSGAVTVTTPGGGATSPGAFSVGASPAPQLTGFAPTAGGPNQVVTIRGRGLLGTAGVAFGGVAAGSFGVVADTVVTAVVPLNALTGPITVTTPGGVAAIGPFSVGAPVCNLTVDAGPTAVACAANSQTVVLTATAQGAAQVPTYTAAAIPFAPLSSIGKAGPTGDDVVSAALPIGFTFSFFGRSYTSFYLSTNGNIQFSAAPSNSPYYIRPIPGGDPGGTNNFIALAWSNWNRTSGGTITYYTTGTAPNRKLVVSFTAVPHVSGGARLTAQAVLYESSNLIDLLYSDIGPSAPWILAGVQNASGSVGVALPGRNNTYWRGSSEAWRLTPASVPGPVAFGWSGPGILSTQGTSATVRVTGPTYFTVTATDSLGSRTDSVLVDTQVAPPRAGDATRCGPGAVVLTATGAPAGGSYQWYDAGGAAIAGATDSVFVTPVVAATTTFSVAARTRAGCESTGRAAAGVSILPLPATPVVTAAPAVLLLTQSTTLTVSNAQAGVTYSWSGPGLAPVTGTSVTVTPPTLGLVTYTVAATAANGCPAAASGTATLEVNMMAAPKVTTFSPASGPAGTSISITGTNLSGASAVTFNGVPAASFVVNSSTSITAVVPLLAGTGPLGVTTLAGPGISAAIFKVRPAITGFTPTSAMPGDVVTIHGSGFGGVSSVKFGTVTTTAVTVLSATTLTATVPPLATTGKIYVTAPGGTGLSPTSFTVGPIATTMIPTQGAVGSVVLVQGLNFVSGTTVRINGIAAPTTYNSSQQLTAIVPATTTGPVSATNLVGTSSVAATFKVVSGSAPTISAVTPTADVVVGTVVTISGANFSGATLVRFNNVNAASFTANSATSITATVPAGATTGRIYVATPSGMGQSAASLTIVPPPTLKTLEPGSGSPGAIVLLTGSNLTGARRLTLNGMPVTYVVKSATQLVATIPPGATTGQFAVTTVAGTATAPATFTITTMAAPVISTLSPGSSGIRGSTLIVDGANFTGEVAVKIGSIAVTGFTLNSPTRLTLTVPATAVTGRVYVTASGGMAQSAADFVVLLPPTISSFSPTTAAVGALVTINGTNLTGATGVTVGGKPVGSFTIFSATRLTATVPVGATTGFVKVTTPAGTVTAETLITIAGSRPGGLAADPAAPLRVALYPNPATGSVGVQISGLTASQPAPLIELFDATGRRVRAQAPEAAEGRLSLAGLAPGVYTVRVGAAVQRLVVE